MNPTIGKAREARRRLVLCLKIGLIGGALSASLTRAEVTVLHSFSGQDGDGAYPRGSLALDGTNIHGMTAQGGTNNNGIVFQTDTAGSNYTILRKFTGNPVDGSDPYGALTFYGTPRYGLTYLGGISNRGTVFAINPDGSNFEITHDFRGGPTDGQYPVGDLARNGNTFFGMTYNGGISNKGVVFRMRSDGTDFTVLHSFTGATNDGANPYSSISYSGTNLYGLTLYGGISNAGVIFKMNTNGSGFSVLHSFTGGTADGSFPQGALSGYGTNLYGMTYSGGDQNMGVVFRIRTDGSGYTLLREFRGGGYDGANPRGRLDITGSGTNLSGMTFYGGLSNAGTVFRMGADGTGFEVLHSFTGGADGAYPYADLTDIGSAIYGMTYRGGANDKGVVFKLQLWPVMSVIGTNGDLIADGEAASAPKGTDYGSLPWASALTNVFMIQNGGYNPLLLSSCTTNGTGAAAFRVINLSSTVAGNNSGIFAVAFAPPAAGAYTAALALVRSGAGTQSVVNVAGTGLKRDQTISFPVLSDQAATSVVQLAATASSELPVSFRVADGPAIISAGTTLTFTATGRVSVVAGQAGDANWNAAPDVTNSCNVVGSSGPNLPTHHYADVDIDGDRKADLVIFDPLTGAWRAKLSASGYAEVSGVFGDSACTLVPGDYDGDRLTDPGIYQEASGKWQVMLSASGYAVASATLGGLGYAPTPGDFDGDRKTDLGVYEAVSGKWQVLLSASGYTGAETTFGGADYLPVQRDYDGDLKYDPAIYHLVNGAWQVMLSGSSYGVATATGFGGTGYAPVVGDYDGDGKADPALYHEATGLWTVMLSGSGYLIAYGTLGGTGYAALPADYDGDGKTDPAVYNTASGQWLVMLSGSGYGMATATFGGAGYDPVGLQ